MFALVAVAVIALDQLSKLVIVANLSDRAPIRLLGGLLTITYTRNPGAAFSLGTGFTLIFTAVAVAVVVVIIRSARRLYSVGWAVALGGLLGGAVGNLTDRLLRAPGPGRGHVVDWIQLPHFAVFNLADSAITCSAVGMVLLTLLGREMDGGRHGRSDG
jgi:signal peptidase II